ncbi:hypothetical protein [Amycolatopsis methanolica]|uniref:hypothetical protein n=1 Tax=Amycolatopsis methanolica TaxID=1814 RepID=UPI000A61CD85
MPNHMVPGFVKLMTELPKTATGKLQKAPCARRRTARWTCGSGMRLSPADRSRRPQGPGG